MNKRLVSAVFLAPLLGGLVFGPFVVVAYFYMLLVTILGAGPVFLLLCKLKKLNWWLATVSGLSLAIAVVYASNFGFDGTLNQFDLACIIAGTLSGNLFFWIGIFRNPGFSFVKTTFPVSSLSIIPILAGLALVALALDGEAVKGKSITIQTKERSSEPTNSCKASVILSNGQSVNAGVSNCKHANYESAQESCFAIGKKLYLPNFKYEYTVYGKRSANLCS